MSDNELALRNFQLLHAQDGLDCLPQSAEDSEDHTEVAPPGAGGLLESAGGGIDAKDALQCLPVSVGAMAIGVLALSHRGKRTRLGVFKGVLNKSKARMAYVRYRRELQHSARELCVANERYNSLGKAWNARCLRVGDLHQESSSRKRRRLETRTAKQHSNTWITDGTL